MAAMMAILLSAAKPLLPKSFTVGILFRGTELKSLIGPVQCQQDLKVTFILACARQGLGLIEERQPTSFLLLRPESD
jgi:hypothetical protein